MFGIGETELVIIVVFAFLLFGPDKLPGMGRTLGRVLRQFREASDGFTEVVQANIMDPASEELEKSPKQRKREAAATRAEDADVEETPTPEVAEAPRRETFAERKARLAAEREAALAAEAAAEGGVPEAGESPEPAAETDAGQETPAEAAAPTTAADLYAMTSQKSSRSRAVQETVTEADTVDANATDETLGEEDGDQED